RYLFTPAVLLADLPMAAEEPRSAPPQPSAPQRPEQRPPRNDQRPPRNDQRGLRNDQRDDRRDRPPRPKRSPEDRNTIFIGQKPPMNYVLAVVTQFNGGSDEVVIRARGKAISQAVDVAEIVRNKFFQKASVKNVAIGTESVTGDDGRKRAVS